MAAELQVTLSPEVAAIVVEEAARLGTSADVVANEAIRQRYVVPANGATSEPSNLADALGPFLGAIQSGGANMSEDCGEKFAEGMAEKRRQGKL